ncbi:FemAB family XrtA/PEP-CTERM system-associated protein [Sphingomonas sp.]|uniref:FemAB family XrtA/PEP-CTERM system-associated protein n=1 Tax=Sphingomonas sp. TaxID=28214 RepID=UPI002FCC5497
MSPNPLAMASLSARKADLGDAGERRRIDSFVMGRDDASLFHRTEWSLAVERGCGQRAHYLIAEDQHGALVGLLPLSEIRSPLFGSALVSAGFAVGGGVIAGSAAAAELLAASAWQLAAELGCPTLELRGGCVPAGFTAREHVYAGFARDLPGDEEAMLKAIPRKQRAEVRRAQGLGLDCTIGRGDTERLAHRLVYAESVRNLGTPVFPRRLFSAMLDAFGADADILTISEQGRPLASVLSFYFKGTAYPYWGGGTRQARNVRANELLYFELMRHAAARGCTRFDFGRSKLGTGAYAYKKNWGFEPQPLTYAVRTADGMPPREINPLDPKYRLQIALWRKLPLWLANRLGPPIARGLG